MESEKSCRFVSDTRFGTDADATVRPVCVLVMACALGVAEAEGTSQERSQSANALKNSKSTFSAGASSPMMDWMISRPSRVARASLLLPCAQQ